MIQSHTIIGNFGLLLLGYFYFVAFGAIPGVFSKYIPNYIGQLIGHFTIYIFLIISFLMWILLFFKQIHQGLSCLFGLKSPIYLNSKYKKLKIGEIFQLFFNKLKNRIKAAFHSKIFLVIFAILLISGSTFWLSRTGFLEIELAKMVFGEN